MKAIRTITGQTEDRGVDNKWLGFKNGSQWVGFRNGSRRVGFKNGVLRMLGYTRKVVMAYI